MNERSLPTVLGRVLLGSALPARALQKLPPQRGVPPPPPPPHTHVERVAPQVPQGSHLKDIHLYVKLWMLTGFYLLGIHYIILHYMLFR